MFKKKFLFQHLLISYLGIFLTILTFIPSLLLLDSYKNNKPSSTLSHSTINDIKDSINSNLYIHSCLGSLCCTFPLLFDHLFDISVTKLTQLTKLNILPQLCLILAITIPSLIIYQASVTGNVSTSKNFTLIVHIIFIHIYINTFIFFNHTNLF